jgi:hypothetical protein
MATLIQAEQTRPLSDLAAGLTDLALEILTRAGVRGDSVEMELETWRTLTDEIEHEFDLFQTRPSFNKDFSLGGVIEQSIHRAALRVASAFDPEISPAEIEARIRPGVASIRVPADRRVALERLTTSSSTGRRPLGKSGLVRRFQVSTLN